MPLITKETMLEVRTRGLLGHSLDSQGRKHAMMTLQGRGRDRSKRNYRQRKTWQSQILKESQMGRWHPGERGERPLAETGTSQEPEPADFGKKAHAAA